MMLTKIGKIVNSFNYWQAEIKFRKCSEQNKSMLASLKQCHVVIIKSVDIYLPDSSALYHLQVLYYACLPHDIFQIKGLLSLYIFLLMSLLTDACISSLFQYQLSLLLWRKVKSKYRDKGPMMPSKRGQ